MKKAHFFCENCGSEVPQDARVCAGCGRRFESVRCPACGFVGEEALFGDGCPVCGHSSGKAAALKDKAAGQRRYAAPSLPLWVYLIVAAAMIGVFGGLFFLLN